MKRLNISLLALAAAMAAQGAAAEDILLDEILITANQTDTEATRAGASVTVQGGAELRRATGPRGTDALARVPGLAVRTLGPVGTQAGITLRGVPHTNVQVRVDGIDVSDPSGTQVTYDFGRLLTGDVSRLEVARGAQSALYGSRANGGVIAITTRRATEEGTRQEAAAEYGSYNTRQLSYGMAVKKGVNDFAFTLSHMASDGFSAADESLGFTEADGFKATRLSFAAGTELANGVKLGVNGFYEDSWLEYDEAVAGIPLDGSPDEQENRYQTGLRLTAGFTTGAVDHELEAAYFDSDRYLSGSNGFGPFAFNFRGTRETLGYRGVTGLGANGKLTFGAEHVRERYADATGPSFADPSWGSQRLSSTIDSVFGEYSLAATGDLDIVVSGRVDNHSRFGSFATGRLSVNWRPADEWTVRANIGNGYRAPSNYELFDIYAGNASLTPETSISADLGVERRFGDQGRVALTLFSSTARDLIDYSYTTYAYVQRSGTARRSGVEVEGDWTFANGMTLGGSYTWSDAGGTAVLDSSAWLANTPRHMLAVTLGADITGTLRADMGLQLAAGRVGLADYTVANLGLTQDLGQGREAYLRVENLFDEDYQVVPGYGTPERSVYVGLRAKF